MSKKIELRRGCFDRYDEEPSTNEYASPPCYMHEVDPSYFGLAPSSNAAPPPKSLAPRLIRKTFAKVHAMYNEITIAWRKSRKNIWEPRETVERYPMTQMERLEAPRRAEIGRRH